MVRALAILSLLVLLVPAAAAGDAGEPEPTSEETWSLRLMQEQARVDHARKRLDEANAAYVRAVAKGEDALVVSSFEKRRGAAIAELADAERTLPRLVDEARADGVGERVLRPYRFAVSPADTP